MLDYALAVGEEAVLRCEGPELDGELFDVGGGTVGVAFEVETVAAVDAPAEGSEFVEALLGAVVPPVGVLE